MRPNVQSHRTRERQRMVPRCLGAEPRWDKTLIRTVVDMGSFLVTFCHARQVTRRWLNKSRMLWILSTFCKALQAYLWPTFQVTRQWWRAPKPQRCNLVKPTRSTVFLLFVSPKELVQNVSHRSLTSSGRSSEWKRKKKALSYSDPQGQSAQSRGVAAWIACRGVQSAEVLAMASLVVQQTQYTDLSPNNQPCPTPPTAGLIWVRVEI